MALDPLAVAWDACALEKITEMVSRRVYVDRGAAVTVVQTHLRKGALVPRHTHAGTQTIYVIQGTVSVTINGESIDVPPASSIEIPAATPHQLEALDDAVVIDVRAGEPDF